MKTHFYNDKEKMQDFYNLSKQDFLESYSYIDEVSYNLTKLESIRASIKSENISYGEIAELQSLAKYIDKNDTELLEWANCCEGCKKPILPNEASVDNRHTTCN